MHLLAVIEFPIMIRSYLNHEVQPSNVHCFEFQVFDLNDLLRAPSMGIVLVDEELEGRE